MDRRQVLIEEMIKADPTYRPPVGALGVMCLSQNQPEEQWGSRQGLSYVWLRWPCTNATCAAHHRSCHKESKSGIPPAASLQCCC